MHHRARNNLQSNSGSERTSKRVSTGYGVVRMLTNTSVRVIHQTLDNEGVDSKILRRAQAPHVTVLPFSQFRRKPENAAFGRGLRLGLDVGRLEANIENATHGTPPPRSVVPVTIGDIERHGSAVVAPIQSPTIDLERAYLIGVAVQHGMSPKRIAERLVPPHITLGFVEEHRATGVAATVEEALAGLQVHLRPWEIYEGKYSR